MNHSFKTVTDTRKNSGLTRNSSNSAYITPNNKTANPFEFKKDVKIVYVLFRPESWRKVLSSGTHYSLLVLSCVRLQRKQDDSTGSTTPGSSVFRMAFLWSDHFQWCLRNLSKLVFPANMFSTTRHFPSLPCFIC